MRARAPARERRHRWTLRRGALPPRSPRCPVPGGHPGADRVGFLILSNSIKEIDWADYHIAIPAFVTMLMMPFTYSITNGIGMGFITSPCWRLAAGRGREYPGADVHRLASSPSTT
ncbi:hypothetical protein GCM10017687_49570 [Streptomyces echinatus]